MMKSTLPMMMNKVMITVKKWRRNMGYIAKERTEENWGREKREIGDGMCNSKKALIINKCFNAKAIEGLNWLHF